MKKVTIREVAKKAKVSTATVSLALNGSKRISPETKGRVLQAAKKLNYYPSRSARGLVSDITGNIGFVITENHFLRSEPFYTKIFLGAEFEAHKYDYYVLLTAIKTDFSEEDELPRFVREKNVDGIIIAGKVSDVFIKRIARKKIPIVFIDYEPSFNEFSSVMIDNIKGAQMAVEHLIKLGHKNIGFIGGDFEHPSISERFLGYRLAMEKAGLKYDNSFIVTSVSEPTRENGKKASEKLFSKNKNITAVFCCNDAMAFGLLDYLIEKNQSLVNKISIIGFDDIEDDMMVKPSISTVRVRKIDMGIEAVKLLVSIMKTKKFTNKKITVPVELIIRDSTKSINSLK